MSERGGARVVDRALRTVGTRLLAQRVALGALAGATLALPASLTLAHDDQLALALALSVGLALLGALACAARTNRRALAATRLDHAYRLDELTASARAVLAGDPSPLGDNVLADAATALAPHAPWRKAARVPVTLSLLALLLPFAPSLGASFADARSSRAHAVERRAPSLRAAATLSATATPVATLTEAAAASTATAASAASTATATQQHATTATHATPARGLDASSSTSAARPTGAHAASALAPSTTGSAPAAVGAPVAPTLAAHSLTLAARSLTLAAPRSAAPAIPDPVPHRYRPLVAAWLGARPQ